MLRVLNQSDHGGYILEISISHAYEQVWKYRTVAGVEGELVNDMTVISSRINQEFYLEIVQRCSSFLVQLLVFYAIVT